MRPSALAAALLGCLATSVDAAPIVHAGAQLTAKAFASRTGSGDWFVEFYSPYCVHCRGFAVRLHTADTDSRAQPEWKKFVDGRKEGRIHFGQVDCAAHGDFCGEQKVSGYPTLRLYRNGNFLMEYAGDRSAENMDKFLAKHAPAPIEVAPAVESEAVLDVDAEVELDALDEAGQEPSQSSAEGLSDEPTPPETPVIQHAEPDSPQFVQQLQARTPNEEGTVEVLDAKTFPAMTSDAQRGPTFVKFYAPWCSHCKALAPLWTKLAAELKGRINVAEVNCEASGGRSICSQQGIKGFPTLLLFDGPDKAEYSGARSVPLMSEWALGAVEASGLQPTNASAFRAAVESQPVVFLFAHPSATSQSEMLIVNSAAKTLLGSAPVYSSSAPDVVRLLGSSSIAHPTLAVFKGRDLTPLVTYQLETDDRDTIVAWLSAHKLPLAGQLTAATYPEYLGDRARTRLTVLVALSEAPQGSDVVDRSKTVLSSIARSWIVDGGDASAEANDVLWSGVSFAWVDATMWAGWLRSSYALIVGSMPTVVIAEPKPGLYYDADAAGDRLRLDGPQLLAALESISKGEIEPKSSRTATERAAHALVGRMSGFLYQISKHPLRYGLLVIAICGAIIALLLKLAAEPLPRSLSSRSVPKRD